MGIFDGYQFDPNSFGAGGLLGLLAQNGINLPMGQPQGGFPAAPPPTDVSAAQRQPGQGVTLPQQGASGFGRDAGPQNPFATLFGGLGDAVGGLFGGGGQQAQQPQLGARQAPGANITPPLMSGGPQSGPGPLDHLTAAWQGLGHGGLTSALGGLVTGQRQDPQGLLERALVSRGVSPDMAHAGVANPQLLPTLLADMPQQATLHALIQAGVPPAVAQAAALNPEVLKTIAPQLYTRPTIEKVKNALGGEDLSLVDVNKGTATPLTPGGGGGAGGGPGGPQMLAPGVKQYNPTLTGEDYMGQFGPEIQDVAKMFLRGDQMPTGNPRIAGIIPFAKTVATKYAQDMGIPFSDNLYAEKRKMRTDLAASSNNSMGGILSNGDSAFAHLAELSGSMADLGNYAGPNIPGGGHIGDAGNFISNALLPTPQTKGKLQGIRDNALKYGQESTKLYAGTGGGEGERMHALNEVAGAGTNSEVQAAFLEKEKSLMLDRMRSKFAQVRDTLGEEEAQRVIAKKTPSLEANLAKIDANIMRLRGQGGAATPGQQQAPSIGEGATATNPQTGQKIQFKGGQWVPMQ